MEEKKVVKETTETEVKSKISGLPRNTVILIVLLLTITVILLTLALYNFNLLRQPPTGRAVKSTSPSYARAVLNILPPQSTVSSTGLKTYMATVRINTPATGVDRLSAAQIDLSYDPKILSNVDIKAGPLIDKPVVLLKKIDTKKGIINFDLAPNPTEKNLGYVVGDLAVVTFTINPSAKGTSAINFLPSTIITSAGYPQSILQQAIGTSFTVNAQ